MVSLLVPKAKMFLFTIVSLLVMATDHFLKARKLNLSLHAVIKGGKHRKFQPLNRHRAKKNYPPYIGSQEATNVELHDKRELIELKAQPLAEQLAVRS
ncbi:UNVERIFIED_CONTAM: hypothetical protein GTU68_050982 [Idotea baltica]|nr:hypothetical protein [Idotea baltica]